MGSIIPSIQQLTRVLNTPHVCPDGVRHKISIKIAQNGWFHARLRVFCSPVGELSPPCTYLIFLREFLNHQQIIQIVNLKMI